MADRVVATKKGVNQLVDQGDAKDLVRLIKSDLKDAKKKEKIRGVVSYSVQEAFKSDQYAEKLSTG